MENLLTRIQKGWNELNGFIESLTGEQLTIPTDPAGWTVKDHLMHLAVWEDGIEAMLNGQSRIERMGVDRDTWQSRDFDRINAIIQQQHKHRSIQEVIDTLHAVHQRLTTKLQTLKDADLQRPASNFDPTGSSERVIIDYIVGDTYGHYEEHIPWMRDIAEKI